MSQTVGQLERELSQRLQAFYRENLGKQPSRVTCQLFNSTIAIVLEDVVTSPEQLLEKHGQEDLATTVNTALGDAIRPHLIQLIESVLEVEVMDLLSDTTMATGRKGIIAILSTTPSVSNPGAVPKYRPKKKETPEG